MRAVASVWPYITTNSKPDSAAEFRVAPHPLGRHAPAGLREVAQAGQLAVPSNPVRSRRSKVCGTPAKLVDPLVRAQRSQKHWSTTDSSVSTTLAPASRWLLSTDSP